MADPLRWVCGALGRAQRCRPAHASAFSPAPQTLPTCPPAPRRHLADGLGSLGNPVGSPLDKVKVGIFRLQSLLGSLDDLLAAPETTTLERLRVRCRRGACGALAGRGVGPCLGRGGARAAARHSQSVGCMPTRAWHRGRFRDDQQPAASNTPNLHPVVATPPPPQTYGFSEAIIDRFFVRSWEARGVYRGVLVLLVVFFVVRLPRGGARLRLEGRQACPRYARPAAAGIFFDRSLTTTSRLFSFVMRMLATGGWCGA